MLEERRPRVELELDGPGAIRLQGALGFDDPIDGSHVKRARG